MSLNKKNNEFFSLLYCRIVSMDPLYGETDCDMMVQNQIFESLFEISPETLSLRPLLVKSYSYSDDLLKYTINLKEGIRFHDDTILDADDVIFTFERIAKERPEKIGFLNTLSKCDHDCIVPGIRKINNYTIEFTLEKPSAVFLNWLADPLFSILPKSQRESIKNGYFKTHPIGSGAFLFVNSSNHEGVELDAFNKHHLGRPDISRIHFPFLSEGEAKKKFMEGNLDQLFPYRLTKNQLNETSSFQEIPYRIFYTIKINPTFYNHSNNPFLSLENRKAFRQALHIHDLQEQIKNKILEPSNGFIPFGLSGYSRSNVEKLSSENFKKGLDQLKKHEILIGCSSGVDDIKMIVKVLEKNFLEEGMNVKFVIEEVKSVFEGTKQGKYLASITSNFARYPDTLSILEQVDKFGYTSKKYSDILNSARRESDKIKREKIYQSANEFIHNDVAVIPLFHGGNQKGLFSKRWKIPELDFVGELFMKYRNIKLHKN